MFYVGNKYKYCNCIDRKYSCCVAVIRESRSASAPALTLASGMIEQVEQTPINQVDIDSILSQWPAEGASNWPYGGAVSSPILSPQSSASVQSPVAPPDGHDQPNIDLKIRLSQYWAGCNSLLISVAPYWLMVNETDVDIVVIDDANGQHWNLAHNMTIAPPEFEVITICTESLYFY